LNRRGVASSIDDVLRMRGDHVVILPDDRPEKTSFLWEGAYINRSQNDTARA
jgi:hypothetical protein